MCLSSAQIPCLLCLKLCSQNQDYYKAESWLYSITVCQHFLTVSSLCNQPRNSEDKGLHSLMYCVFMLCSICECKIIINFKLLLLLCNA